MQTVEQRREMNTRCITLYHRIDAFIKQFGYPPNYREMCKLIDLKSTSQVGGLLTILEKWHWVQLDDGNCRTLRLIRPTEMEVPEQIRERALAKAAELAEKWETEVAAP